MRPLGLCAFVLLGSSTSVFAQQLSPPATSPNEIMARLAQSHIQGNVPDKAHFEKFLARDLTAYFTNKTGKKVTVKYDFLRNGPTQSGVSFPKYYLWVRVFQNRKMLEAGAIRIAAVDRTQFDVTTYLTKAIMERSPEQIYQAFPRPVGDKIKKGYLKR